MTSLLVKKAVTVAYNGLQESVDYLHEIETLARDEIEGDVGEKLYGLVKALEKTLSESNDWLVAVKEDK
jgi:hypothetical protein